MLHSAWKGAPVVLLMVLTPCQVGKYIRLVDQIHCEGLVGGAKRHLTVSQTLVLCKPVERDLTGSRAAIQNHHFVLHSFRFKTLETSLQEKEVQSQGVKREKFLLPMGGWGARRVLSLGSPVSPKIIRDRQKWSFKKIMLLHSLTDEQEESHSYQESFEWQVTVIVLIWDR